MTSSEIDSTVPDMLVRAHLLQPLRPASSRVPVSALEVFLNDMRYINPRFTYLLTSGLGPASYIITAADLHPVTNGNRIVKFADDTYLVVPASNSSSRLL